MSVNETSTCRFCSKPLKHKFADLGKTPFANAYLDEKQLKKMEPFFPLQAYVCEYCFLVQLEEFETPQNIFGDYAYFSSYSDSFLQHAKDYTNMMLDRFEFDESNFIVEIASNDGYLLTNFVKKNIPVLGIEPAENIAEVAEKKGVPSLVRFFGKDLAKELKNENKQADLIIGNNVLAHVPDLNDFVSGLKILLKPNGVITIEFPHLMHLINDNLFDTIYHEHFSYFSFLTVEKVFREHGLELFDVEEIATHGGSLRIYGKHEDDSSKRISERVKRLRSREINLGYNEVAIYKEFNDRVRNIKRHILQFLIELKNQDKSIVGYGAPAKANTLFNYCGIRSDFIDYIVDRSPHKQGSYLPGTYLPIYDPEKISDTKPDYIFILPWNLKDEIISQLDFVREWNGKFFTVLPEITVID